jgi:M6 family metalloprotease-like protein
MYVWTIVVRTAVNDSKDNFFDVVSQKALDSSGETPYTPVTNLSTKVEVDEVSDIAVTFSGELAGYGLIFVAPTINGIVEVEQEVILYHPVLSCPDPVCASPVASDSGVGSYTFGIKSISPSEEGYEIGVAYRVLQAGASTEGTGFISDANLVVEKKLRVGPDLAVGPNMGRASRKRESIIEPVYGSRSLLAIIIDPEIVGGDVSPKFIEEIDDALNGDFQSAKDYYLVVSGGRFEIEKADTLGIYKAEYAGETTNDTNYYLDSANFDCEQDTKFGSSSDALHADALLQAEDDFDFAAYDRNNDGEITPNELGIIVAIPRDSISGSSIKPDFSPYCSGEEFIVDGVRITETVHLNVLYQEGGLTDEQKLENMMAAAHELAHHFLGMDDLYGRYKGVFDGENFTLLLPFQDDCPDDLPEGQSCQIRYVNTAPHMMSLMTHKTGDNMTTTHLDGFHKLHLGWARPWIPEKKDEYELADVKVSEDVFILPRRHDDGREYVLLESRIEEDDPAAALYDYGILDYGLAVYHVIEPGPICKSPFGASAPDCKPLIPPMCIGEDVWYFKHASNYTRVGLRLVQPDLVHRYDQDVYDSDDDYTGFSNTLFGLGGSGETLISDGEMLCPQNIGDELPAGGAPLLLWVDGTPSGYNLLDIVIDYPAGASFKLVID